ncbi:MAG: HEPN domain-containing protein [Firmicutes bacterium]|nr:HEPN domain-containing protein [Bacillota bacterium]
MGEALTEDIRRLLLSAENALKESQALLSLDLYAGAVSRAYYAMFYMASAVLRTKELEFSKHSAVIAAFGQHFVKTGLVPKNYQKLLLDAFDVRQRADDQILLGVSKEMAQSAYNASKSFVEGLKSWIVTPH